MNLEIAQQQLRDAHEAVADLVDQRATFEKLAAELESERETGFRQCH